MSEMAVVSSRKSRLKQWPRTAMPVRPRRSVWRNSNRFLPVQVGITMIGLLAGAFSGATLAAALTVENAVGFRRTPMRSAWRSSLLRRASCRSSSANSRRSASRWPPRRKSPAVSRDPSS